MLLSVRGILICLPLLEKIAFGAIENIASIATPNQESNVWLRILKDILFRTELCVSCQSEHQETASIERSDAYHPQAYNDGYREGIASKANRETYQARTAGGEFARGFEDGYFGKANSGQRYTALPIKDYQCQCRLLHNSAADREY